MSGDKNCCSKCCSGCGKCFKKTGKCMGHCCCGFLGGFYGCTRRKAIINHEPGLLVLHIVPMIFSALTLVASLVDYRFLEDSTSSVAPDVLSRWFTFQKFSMGISSSVMAILALNLCFRLHVVRDEFKKPCLYSFSSSLFHSFHFTNTTCYSLLDFSSTFCHHSCW